MNLLTEAMRHRRRFLFLAAFLVLCVTFGGSSRTDHVSMLVLRPIAVLYMTVALLLPGRRDWAGLGWPLALLGAFAMTMAMQLVPLPPAIWTALPGQMRFAEAAAALGVAQPWRPISLAPDMTLNSLLALVVPCALLVGAATVPPSERVRLLPVLLAAIVASAVLGIAQWAGGPASPLYFIQRANRDLPNGVFANRNHQAVFLALALPLLRVWVVLPSRLVPRDVNRAWLAGAITLLVVPVILATGSRSGLVLAVFGAAAALAIAPPDWRSMAGHGARRRLAAGAGAAAIVASAASLLLLGRAVSITRLAQIGAVEADLRVRFLPVVLWMTRDFLPLGSGYGTFEDLFHVYEPFWALKRTEFNHAHNDLIELVLTGGVPALLVLLAFGGFLVIRTRAILAWGRQRSAARVAASGLALVLMLLAASLSDYPLRTPALAMVLALAAAWLAAPLAETRRTARPGRADVALAIPLP